MLGFFSDLASSEFLLPEHIEAVEVDLGHGLQLLFLEVGVEDVIAQPNDGDRLRFRNALDLVVGEEHPPLEYDPVCFQD
eukprot:CAMPEP_0170499136 /NCGR_PEP_ID=MMETSP0208-20121228/30261_1 /TAXON_ID=197538 /ORGANISM="Strombidium inclinatum, Strain S3" /LENGTH=78 /DNA_ID=CAMNT_0010776575 /DNA_START=1732 /DNA_END=1968 /DNA_ORIENTATION=+